MNNDFNNQQQVNTKSNSLVAILLIILIILVIGIFAYYEFKFTDGHIFDCKPKDIVLLHQKITP